VQPARSIAEGWDFPQLGLRGLQNFLKLRTRHRFSDRLTADLGVDINAVNQAIVPRAALSYQVCPSAHHFSVENKPVIAVIGKSASVPQVSERESVSRYAAATVRR
jgi:hypothetical protein